MKYDLVLVSLNQQQIEKAKEINGARKQITHGLLCGPYGQMFGTEKQCRKYYSVWVNIFPLIFEKGLETENHEITNYEATFNLVNKLIEVHDPLEKANNPIYKEIEELSKKKKKGFFAKLFG
jgi:hypothetical protein